jgi:hypothetical protein
MGMVKTTAAERFMPSAYCLSAGEAGLVKLTIYGSRTGRPSKRLALNVDNLKVINAAITSEAKNKTIAYEVVRINHLPTIQEVRLHTKNLQYPGPYRVDLTYSGVGIEQIKVGLSTEPGNLRLYMPSIDEPGPQRAAIRFN